MKKKIGIVAIVVLFIVLMALAIKNFTNRKTENNVFTDAVIAGIESTGEEKVIEKVTIKESKKIEDLDIKTLLVRAEFTREFMDNYQYEDSKGYKFAISLDDVYFNVFRNENGGVSNSIKHGLTGAIPAYKFKTGFTWEIPMNTQVKVAKPYGQYGYEYKTFYTTELLDYNIRVSPVKEGVETHHIKLDVK